MLATITKIIQFVAIDLTDSLISSIFFCSFSQYLSFVSSSAGIFSQMILLARLVLGESTLVLLLVHFGAMNCIQLLQGVLPAVGLGVYRSTAGSETYDAVYNALKLGYRHFDTAQIYRNEQDVGSAINQYLQDDSSVTRADIFITTKVWLNNFGYESCIESVEESLAKLQTPYIDLVLLHAPGDSATRADTWRALESLQEQGLIKDIGVSNFGIPHIEKLSNTWKVKPAVNQIELHPWLQRRELVKYCQDNGIVVEAYSPLAKATSLEDATLVRVANSINKTPAEVLIAWSLAKGFVTLPKSVNPTRQKTNLDAATLILSNEHIAELDTLEEYRTTGWDPVKDAPV